jgi:8-hydroxy-5-deazaflavin:NADPH oxidoreductase
MTRPSRRQFVVVLVAAALAVSASALPTWAQSKPKIGLIGSGRQGGALGVLFAKAGYPVLFSSRHPEQLKDIVAKAGPNAKAGLPQDAATFGDIVVIAVPYGVTPQIGKDYAALMKGKIVIDLGNPREDRDGPMATDAKARGTGVATAGYIPGVRLVRAFNALSFVQVERDAHRAGEKLGIPVAGDDPAAVKTVVQLVIDSGFDPVVTGNLASSKNFDTGTAVYVKGMTATQIKDTLKLP